MSRPRILIIDDDDGFRFALRKALRRLGYETLEAGSGEAALPLLTGPDAPDAALLDLRMRGMNGLDVLRQRGGSPVATIVLTGHGTVEAAVEAMRLGAFSFLEKPVDGSELAPLLESAIRDTRQRTKGEVNDFVPPLIGTSDAMQEVAQFIATVGPTSETVTVFGETGTGKEIVARHIHRASRREGAFVALNAACVPRELFESELFGHKRGAFTGATADRLGLFREAQDGTLFIDELGELPVDMQAKLLRVLETRKVRGVGDSKEHDANARIVAATNRDLWADVGEGRFREDLYFRLQVFPIVLQPLRERREDILPLAQHLLDRVGHGSLKLSEAARDALLDYDWPGNVRELLNVLRRASLFAKGDTLDGEMVRRMEAASVFGHAGARQVAQPTTTTQSLAEVERQHIEKVLDSLDGNVTRAAIQLGIDRRTLQRKLKAFGLSDS